VIAGLAGTRPARPLPLGVAALMLAGAALLSGCQQVESTATASGYQPARVEEVDGGEAVQVTFTQDGAARVGLQQATAATVDGQTVMPYAALIYDGQGVPWVYTAPDELTFRRVQVEVDRIEGDRVYLSGGLSAGTRVVTVGAAEVYGTELGISGGK